MAGVDSVLRKARARLQAAAREQSATERNAAAAENRSRDARLRLKQARKDFKKASKANRKAQKAVEAARKSFSKAAARARKEEARAAKAGTTLKKGIGSRGRRAAAITADRKPSQRKPAAPKRARGRPGRRAHPTDTVAQATQPEMSRQAETFELNEADLT